MTGKRVLGIGLDPYTIDIDSDFFRGKPLKRRRDRGRDQGERGAHSLRMAADRRAWRSERGCPGALARQPVDVVAIGDGVRLDPAQTPVLEAVVNAVIEAAPGVWIAFNTSPTDTAEAIGRAS